MSPPIANFKKPYIAIEGPAKPASKGEGLRFKVSESKLTERNRLSRDEEARSDCKALAEV